MIREVIVMTQYDLTKSLNDKVVFVISQSLVRLRYAFTEELCCVNKCSYVCKVILGPFEASWCSGLS